MTILARLGHFAMTTRFLLLAVSLLATLDDDFGDNFARAEQQGKPSLGYHRGGLAD
jgi:hypothetical protein